MGSSQSTRSLGMSVLPDDVLLEVLVLVPAADLLHRCRPVCKLWREIIDSPSLWRMKCQRDAYISPTCRGHPRHWGVYYYLASTKRNLLRNPNAMEKFKHWEIKRNGGNRWKVEKIPGDMGGAFPAPEVTKYFVTSFDVCIKAQLIELKKMGYSDRLMDDYQPDIVISDWYAARRDCACQYEIVVHLLSESKDLLVEFHPEPVRIEQWSDGSWHQMTHTFSNYGPGVRYIYFSHGGKDLQFWAGWYGVRVTNSSITIEPEDLRVRAQAENLQVGVETEDPSMMDQSEDQSVVDQKEDLSEESQLEDLCMSAQVDDLRVRAHMEDLRVKAQMEDLSMMDQTEGSSMMDQTEGSSMMDQTEGSSMMDQTEGSSMMDQTEDSSMKAQVEDPRVKAQKEDPSVKTQAEDSIVKAQREDPSLKAQAEDPSLKAQAEDPSLKAQAEDPSLKAQAEDPSLKAQAEDPSVKAQAEDPSVKAQPGLKHKGRTGGSKHKSRARRSKHKGRTGKSESKS